MTAVLLQPETVPHGVIDMSKVLEVADAEDVTGNSYSVALTAPDRVTFIKGTCREECRWWMDALNVYTTSMVKVSVASPLALFVRVKIVAVSRRCR